MKMWYNSGYTAGFEVVFDTGAASLYVRLTREPKGTADCSNASRVSAQSRFLLIRFPCQPLRVIFRVE
jgi:hypothetical protein